MADPLLIHRHHQIPSLHQLLLNAISVPDTNKTPYFSVSEPIIPAASPPALILPFSNSSKSELSSDNDKLRLLPLEFNEFKQYNNADDKDGGDEQGIGWPVLYALLFLLGTVLNCTVLWRMRRTTKGLREKEQNHNGIGACLRTMACTDLAALWALLAQFLITTLPEHALPDAQLPLFFGLRIGIRDAVCKGSVLVAHAAYSQTMWCWVFMSGARYLATRRPLQYFALWRLPHMAIGLMALGSFVLQAWLLADVWWWHGGPKAGSGACVLETTIASRAQACLDVLLSFALPLLLLLHMDIRVLCRRKKHADPMLQIVINRPNGERKRIFHRFILIVFTSVLLNVPGNAFRLLAAVGLVGPVDRVSPNLLWLFNTLHISQFTFNALYLSSFMHERSQFSKSNSSRQLSISIRQRLEDGGGHFIRERASTISYRASTPTPGLLSARIKNANSCCAIDFLCPPAPTELSWV